MISGRRKPPRTGQLAVLTTPQQVAGENFNRGTLAVVNLGPATVYVGFDPNVTVNTGFALPVNVGVEIDNENPLFAVAVATGTTVSFMEELA